MFCRKILMAAVIVCFVSLLFSLSVYAGILLDEFDSGELEDVWEVRAVGDASYRIENGQLIMESPAVADGILLLYTPEITGEDITFEFQLDVSEGGDPSALIWFADEPLTPDVNTTVNTHLILRQTIVSGSTYVKIAGEVKAIADTPVDTGGPNVYKFEFTGNTVTFYVNGEKIDTIDKPDGVSYFHIGPDMYTSHYDKRIGVLDYVKISGPNVKPLAVEPAGKLAATWAELKK